MAVSTRLIKRRIKSITNTKKITKAMELVAASKMKRAVQMTTNSRSYAGTAKEIVDEIQKLVNPQLHRMLFAQPHAKEGKPLKTLVIVCTSDRGLCGGFNAQCLKRTIEFIKERESDQLSIVTVGKRANQAMHRLGLTIAASFEAISNAPSFSRSKPIGLFASQEFLQERTDRVFIVYMDFKSALRQVPTVEQLLPIIPEQELEQRQQRESDILFEPDPNFVLESLLPQFIEVRVYQALLESSASEHSARMMAMRSATDNATDMVNSLVLSYNQARQASITQEISEISAGKAAIE
jgi:F-type H+-transporting ATPase subunit gamma